MYILHQEATGGAGVDVVLEMLANLNLGADLQMLRQGGRVAVRLHPLLILWFQDYRYYWCYYTQYLESLFYSLQSVFKAFLLSILFIVLSIYSI